MLEINNFAECVRDSKLPATPGEEGLHDHVLIEAIYRSAREGRPVRIGSDA